MAPPAKKQRLSNGRVAVVEAQDGQIAPPPPATEAGEDEKDSKAAHQHRTLFVRSLPADTTTESLTELFSDAYPIKHATAVIDPETKQCRGYGFVTFADAEDAQRAKAEFHGRVLQDRKLRVELAERRHRDAGGKDGAAAAPKAAKPEREMQAPPKLIVRNLPWSIKGSHQLEKLFQSYGKVKQAYVPRKGPGLMAGFGFVLMRGRKNAEKAMEGVNGKEIDGRTLAVDWAVEKDVYQGLQKGEGEGEDGGVEVKEEDDEDEEEEIEESMGGVGLADDDEMESDGSDEEDENEDDEDVDIDMDDGDEPDEVAEANLSEDKSTTLFVRNLPFSCTDEDLEDHFTQFGSVRYARVVMDYGTNRSKGTGFVCFYSKSDADDCLRNAPRRPQPTLPEKEKQPKFAPTTTSILQNDMTDPTGQFTLDGRVLQITRAVDKTEASRLTAEGTAHRNKRDNDKRRLYLLSEGTISPKSPLWEKLSPSEKTMREASAKQRKTIIESNPSLNLSLTRLSVRNIPRSITSKDLKALAREAVVGFATDVKAGTRRRLSKEELERGGEAMKEAELARKRAGKGLVRQAKVVFEAASGTKVGEETGAGRSRGYGFIEYYTHRSALMGLRWLNGHAVGYQAKEAGKKGKGKPSAEDAQDRKKRLIVEFAIENAQVVLRRNEREQKARERSKAVQAGEVPAGDADAKSKRGDRKRDGKPGDRKRKRAPEEKSTASAGAGGKAKKVVDEKTARRNQIIGRKRAARKARKG